MNKKILVVAAHPDDETLGCGGAIAKHSNEGDEVKVIVMTDGVSSRFISKSKEVKNRNEALQKAMRILGADLLGRGEFPDNMLDTVPLLELIQYIENLKKDFNFDIIYTHSPSDLNIDHRIIFEATLTAFRPEPKECITEIRSFEIPSSTDYSSGKINQNFSPNLFIDTSSHHELKLKALGCYDMELRDFPHSRSLESINALAKTRGASVGLKMAEAFEVIRRIER